MIFSPIILFAFNRPDALKASLAALKENFGADQSDLFIFIDGPRDEAEKEKVNHVALISNQASGFKSVTVYRSEINRGLGPTIIAGVSEVLSSFDRAIVLEDDLVVTPDFLHWMNVGLEKYEAVTEVFSICGYTNNVKVPAGYRFEGYFAPRSSSWGWATWKDRWESVEWNPSMEDILRNSRAFDRWGGSDCSKMLMGWREGHNKSWAIRFCYGEFLQGKVSLFPVLSHVDPSLGFDGEGTNCRKYSRFRWTLDMDGVREYRLPEDVIHDRALVRSALCYHSLPRRAWSRLMYFIYR